MLFDSNPVKIFFWNRGSPFAAIVKLTKTKFMNNFICFAKQSLIAGFIIVNGSCAQPVTKKVTTQLTGGIFPAAMLYFFASKILITASLLRKILQQSIAF